MAYKNTKTIAKELNRQIQDIFHLDTKQNTLKMRMNIFFDEPWVQRYLKIFADVYFSKEVCLFSSSGELRCNHSIFALVVMVILEAFFYIHSGNLNLPLLTIN